ncbi:hypothetical protein NKR23_g12359 [Pleurostoma richardsiae]|uniref:Uncharacterized protein n=1 Tax=Pleurostoma richardsiae TaxID=41990 RepID=A0AA38VIM0_9PEZI|nr:hypothetical protein NKR23_g12359 [Pleurostoma richardsiae]
MSRSALESRAHDSSEPGAPSYTLDMSRSPSTDGDDTEQDREGPQQLVQRPTREQVRDWVEEDGLTAEEKLARRLVYLLIAGLVSCPAETHEQRDDVHHSTCRRHLGLKDTWAARSATDSSRSFAEKEEYSGMFGLSARQRPLPSQAMGLERGQLPSASRLDAAFTGWRDQERWKDAEICLHKEDLPGCKIAPAAHDVDSFLHVTRDPSDFKGPLHICLSPQPSRLLSKSIHIKVPVSVQGKRKAVPIHKIPHLVLAHEKFTAVYMFFPRLYTGEKKATVHLRDEQHALFFERVIRPSFERIGMHFEHHLPDNYNSVRSASQIAIEATGSATARGASIEVAYNKENLAELWAVMREVLGDEDRNRAVDELDDTGRLWQFGEPIFLLNRKDTKLLHKSRSTLTSAIDGFWEHNAGAIDPYVGESGSNSDSDPDSDYRDREDDSQGGPEEGDGRTQLLDVASEFMPVRHGHTVLARRCCQHNSMLFLYGDVEKALFGHEDLLPDDEPRMADPSAAGRWKAPRIPRSVTTEYPIHLLRDSVSVTCEPTKTSANFKSGLYYAQSYSILKTIFTKAGVWAFSNDEILNLGHGADVWNALARAARVKQDRAGGDRSLLKSCERMAAAFRDLGRGYGCRLEFRIKQGLARRLGGAESSWWALVRRVNGLQNRRTRDTRPLAVHPDRRAFFVVEAREFNLFLRMNIDKHLRLMDYIRSYHSRDDWSPQAAASLYAVVAVALQEFTMRHDAALSRVLESPLVPAQDRKAGLGMLSIMEARGFAFFPQDVVDWQWLKLQDWATDLIRVPNLTLRAHWREFESLKESKHLYDQVLAMALGPGIQTQEQADAALGILAQLLILEYKKAAFLALFRRPAEDASSLTFTLSRLEDEVSRHQGRRLTPATGNRRDFKHVSTYFDWAWTESVKFGDRKHLESTSFRRMARMSRDALDKMRQNAHVSADRLMVILYYRFSQQIICFPSPDKHNGCLSVTDTRRARLMICTDVKVRDTDVPRSATLSDTVAAVVSWQEATARPVASPYSPFVLGSVDQIRRLLQVE